MTLGTGVHTCRRHGESVTGRAEAGTQVPFGWKEAWERWRGAGCCIRRGQSLQALVCSTASFQFCPEDDGASMVSFNLGREVTEITSQISQSGCSEAGGAVISKEAAVRGGVRRRGEESQSCRAKGAPGIGSFRPCV